MEIVASGLGRDYLVKRVPDGERGLARIFRRETKVVRAVDNVSFTVGDGQSLAYLGLNGAGKSTTLKMLAGVLQPTRGTVRADGRDPMKDRAYFQPRLGYLTPHRNNMWSDLPAQRTFELMARLYRVETADYGLRLAQLYDAFDFSEMHSVPLRELSTGNRTKAELIAMLVHRPSLLILDEPTLGLDILTKESLYGYLRRMVEQDGLGLILATHDLRDVEMLCERVLLIDEGRAMFTGSVSDLRRLRGDKRRLIVDVARDDLTMDLPTCVTPLGPQSGPTREFIFDTAVIPARDVLARLESSDILDIRLETPDLRDVINEVYGRRTASQA